MKTAQADTPPCHEQNTDNNNLNAIMFMTDCMGVDFQAASDDISIEAPDLQINKVIYADLNESLSYNALKTALNTIRGPPELKTTRAAEPSIVLTTQRFRI